MYRNFKIGALSVGKSRARLLEGSGLVFGVLLACCLIGAGEAPVPRVDPRLGELREVIRKEFGDLVDPAQAKGFARGGRFALELGNTAGLSLAEMREFFVALRKEREARKDMELIYSVYFVSRSRGYVRVTTGMHGGQFVLKKRFGEFGDWVVVDEWYSA